jgi:DNA-binding MarR family transcriptional regulator
MTFSDLPEEQQKIVRSLYNEWQANPTGPGLYGDALAKQTGLHVQDLIKEVQRLEARRVVKTGEAYDDDLLGWVQLTDYGRELREG